MKNLSINVAKNVAMSELVCTPNTILLAKQTISERNSEINTSIRYIEICQVEKTDGLTLVKTLLKYCIAEFTVCKELENDFADTNIKQRKLFNQFLTTNKIYRTNAEGKIVSALESEIPFNQTALKVKDTHTIVNCKRENLNACIHQHANAILAQSKYYSLIISKVETLDKEAKTAELEKRELAKVEKARVAKEKTDTKITNTAKVETKKLPKAPKKAPQTVAISTTVITPTA